MNNNYTTNEPKTFKKHNKGCLIAVISVFCFFCLCIVLALTLGTPSSENKTELSKNAQQIKDTCNTSDEQAIAIDEILNNCDIVKIDKIEHDSMLDDMFNSGDTGYRIQSQGIKNVILYLNSNKEVIIIRHADIDIFSENTCKTKFSNFYLTTSQETKLQISTQNGVKAVLSSPSSAKFPSITKWNFHRDAITNIVTIQSYVDHQNSFGATIRSDFIVLYKITGDIEQGKYNLIYFEFNNQVIVDKR